MQSVFFYPHGFNAELEESQVVHGPALVPGRGRRVPHATLPWNSQSAAPQPLGCHILQHFNFSLLPKHFLVQFDERIPKMPKKFNLVDVLVSLWPLEGYSIGRLY